MKRLGTLVLAALLSVGIASVGLAQEAGMTGGHGTEAQASGKAPKKHKKHAKSHKKGKHTAGHAEGGGTTK